MKRLRVLRNRLWITAVLIPSLLIAGCTNADPATTFSDKGSVAERLMDLLNPLLIVAGFVLVGVTLAVTYVLIRYRRKRGQDPRDLPPQWHGNNKLELGWTIIPVVVLAIIAFPTVDSIVDLSEEQPDALQLRVVAHQWWWEFEYPDLGAKTGGEVVIPTNQRIQVSLESNDVIHSFWIPRLAGKLDVIPGHVNKMWFDAREEGVYWGQCVEFCGTVHALMKFGVRAVSPEDFDQWVRENQAPPRPTDALARQGEQTFMGLACIGCHAINGSTTAVGVTGPNLTGFGDRERFAGWYFENNEENLRRWLANPADLKQHVKMPNLGLNDEQITQLIAYLQSLKLPVTSR